MLKVGLDQPQKQLMLFLFSGQSLVYEYHLSHRYIANRNILNLKHRLWIGPKSFEILYKKKIYWLPVTYN